MPLIHAHLLPTLLEETPLTDATCVVIDILRASTTMVHALANGAETVIPCLTVEDAQTVAAQLPAGSCLLGGERHGQLIPGFDLDNSPFGYSPEVVSGKTVIFTTTNGTRALWECRSAKEIVIGAFANFTSVIHHLQRAGNPVHLICAGTNGKMTAEDILFAGAVAHHLLNIPSSAPDSHWELGNLQAELVRDYFAANSATPEAFQQAFYRSQGARNLRALGMDRDVVRSMEYDLFDLVPVWDGVQQRLTASRPK